MAIPRPKPIKGNNPGLKDRPTKNQARPPQKPAYMDAADRLKKAGHNVEKAGERVGKRVIKAMGGIFH